MSDWRPLLERARAQLAEPGEEHPEDLELLGALGRAHASWYEYAAALPLLRRAAQGWLDLERPGDATYPVAELLRVAAASGQRELVDELCAEQVAAIEQEHGIEPFAVAFVLVAAARAQIQCGALDRGGALLARCPLPGARAPAHLRAAWLRWTARLATARGESEGADAALAELDGQHQGDDGRCVRLLARLDRCLALERGLGEALGAARDDALLGRELVRLEAYFAPLGDEERARLLTLHSRY